MTIQPDKFFKEKLSQQREHLSPHLWDALQNRLVRKKRNHFLMWAACITIVVLTTVIYKINYPPDLENPDAMATSADTPVYVQHPVASEQPVEAEPVAEEKQQKKRLPVVPEEKAIAPQDELTLLTTVRVDDLDSIDAHDVQANEVKQETNNHTTYIYTAQLADKFLNKKSLADATPVEEKASSFKTLLKKAQEVNPIEDFRQMKNEILAINYKQQKKEEINR